MKNSKIDIITIAIAFFALALSSLSIYFQFFYQSYRFTVLITDISLHEGTQDKNYYDFTVNAQVAIINTGTRDVVISDLDLESIFSHSAPNMRGILLPTLVNNSSLDLPIIAKEGETIVHKLKFNPGRAGGANLLPSSSGEFILLLVVILPDGDTKEIEVEALKISEKLGEEKVRVRPNGIIMRSVPARLIYSFARKSFRF